MKEYGNLGIKKNRKETTKSTNPWLFGAEVGFFAGLVWGLLKWAEAYLKFTTISIAFMLKPFLSLSFLESGWGQALGLGAFTLFSIGAALLYTLLLRKAPGPWLGILYGILWWGVLYLIAGPAMGMMERLDNLDLNTITSDFCLFLVWGLFIGYSISFEFTDDRKREPYEAGTSGGSSGNGGGRTEENGSQNREVYGKMATSKKRVMQ
ncbi:YqhR family membrane protein [Paenibacillus sp. y28]|uniref:YqhR family membrane protein n=1 Tax=Paenibacillus sp. y28 TaxID=3129110 RepID=UPI003016295C